MPPAARISDMHVCPMVTPGVPPIPHVGGPVSVGCPTVLIGGLPAARVGGMGLPSGVWLAAAAWVASWARALLPHAAIFNANFAVPS